MWYRLDNIGCLYAPSANSKWSGIFRLSAVLQRPIQPQVLQQALDRVMLRCPLFFTRLRQGLFWHYLETTDKKLTVKLEETHPCQFLDAKREEHLIRVLYCGNRIAVEIVHCITDGGGGWIFLKTLLRQYLLLLGVEIASCEGCLDCEIEQPACELEDAYQKTVDYKKGKTIRNTPHAYQIDYAPCGCCEYYITHGQLDTKQLRQIATNHNAKVGNLLTAVVAYALIKYRKLKDNQMLTRRQRPIVVNISFDLRKKFDIQTMRNFFGFGLLQFDSYCDFEEVVQKVNAFYDKIDKDYFVTVINTNVQPQQKLLNKLIPLSIKSPIINLGYRFFGERLATISFSNYGKALVPSEFCQHIERFESINGVAKVGRVVEASAITFDNKTVLSFCAKSKQTQVQRLAFMQLASLGCSVKVDSNCL